MPWPLRFGKFTLVAVVDAVKIFDARIHEAGMEMGSWQCVLVEVG